jgi:tRNA (cmo5U34)-methyltransferase
MTIASAFNASADDYDNWMKKALPCYDDLFQTARELIPFEQDAHVKVLDLGAGTGLFAQHVLEKYPHSNFVLVDIAENMLAVARERFREHLNQFQFIAADYRDLQDLGSFDLVISSLSIHHLADADKQKLYNRIYALLSPGGIFLTIDQIKAPTPQLGQLYWTEWSGWQERPKSKSKPVSSAASPMISIQLSSTSLNGFKPLALTMSTAFTRTISWASFSRGKQEEYNKRLLKRKPVNVYE